VDFAGPYERSKRKVGEEWIVSEMQYVFCIVDRWSHWVMLFATADVTARTAAELTWKAIAMQATIPTLITSDGGPSFRADLYRDAMKMLRSEHHISTPIHPEGHSPVERVFRDLNAALRILVGQGLTNWEDYLDAIGMSFNVSTSRVNGVSPFEALHGFKPRTLVTQEAAGVAEELAEEDVQDPLHFSAELIKRFSELKPKIEEAMKRSA